MKKWMCLLLAVMMLGTAGCGKKEETEEPVVKKEEAKIDVTIGTKTDSALVICLKNNTKKNIIGLTVKHADSSEYPDNLMDEGQIWKQGESAEIYYVPETVDSENEISKAVNDIYQVKFTFEDDEEIELSSLGIADIDGEAELLYEDGVAFVSYKSKLMGSKVSTKEQELGAKQQEEQESETQIQNVDSYEETNYEIPSYQETTEYQDSPVVSEPVSDAEVPAQTVVEPEAPVQSQEGCLTDVEILVP